MPTNIVVLYCAATLILVTDRYTRMKVVPIMRVRGLVALAGLTMTGGNR